MGHTVKHSIAKKYWYNHSFKYIEIHVCYITFFNMPLCMFFIEQFVSFWYGTIKKEFYFFKRLL